MSRSVDPLEDRTLLAAPHPVDLGTLDGTNGFRLDGINANDHAGRSVSDAGDVNGDGFADLLIGARGARESYVVFGKPGGFASSIDLDSLDGTTGFRVDRGGTGTGLSVSSVGDVNGDSFDDLIIGASLADLDGNSTVGESYVVFGKSSGFASVIDLSMLDGTTGFRLAGVDRRDRAGESVSNAGDVNGDGFDDLIIGAFLADPDEKNGAGEGYVVFGKSIGFASVIDLGMLDGTSGFRLDGVDANDYSNVSVSSAGDVNGDGFGDLIIGAFLADSAGAENAGASYVVFGKSGGFSSAIELNSLDGTTGFRIDGIDLADQSGYSVSDAGDVNGDGFDDLIIGAASADPDGNSAAGESYVVFGKSGGFASAIDLGTLDGTNGFRLDGIDDGDSSGYSVSGAGDVNGDGFDDLMIGAQSADPGGDSHAGETYVVFGKAGVFASMIDLSTLNGTSGFQFNGVDTSDASGRSVSNAGDVNGDGFDDMIIGAWKARNFAGESYVVFGGNFTGGEETQVGDATANTLTAVQGGGAIDILIGGLNSDTLISDGGPDVLRGGEGDDTLAIPDANFSGTRRLVGGSGSDRLRLDGTGLTLDLTTIPDNRIVDLEVIDIRGNGSNSLKLDFQEVVNISSTSNTLLVLNDADDLVNVGRDWTQGLSQTIDSVTYEIFLQDAAVLGIQDVTLLHIATHPTPTITSVEIDPTVNPTFEVTINFGEIVNNFVEGDVVVGNGSVTGFVDNGDGTFTLTITATADGTVTVDIPGSVATDTEGDVNDPAIQFSIDVREHGFSITESNELTLVSESGTTDTFDVVLIAQPASDVVLNVTTGNDTEVTVNLPTLTFTTANWNSPRTVTISAVDDSTTDGNQNVQVTVSVDDDASHDDFDNVSDQSITVTTIDNDIIALSLDGGGNLVIDDTSTDGLADNLTLLVLSTELLIFDPDNVLVTSVGTQVSDDEVRVPLALITNQQIVVNHNQGDDRLNAASLGATLSLVAAGGPGDDTLTGSSQSDTISGGSGDDSIVAGSGDDLVDGGEGNDDLDGGTGNDTLSVFANANLNISTTTTTGAGSDSHQGFDRAVLTAGPGNNRLDATAADIPVTLNGLSGNDTLLGGPADDRLDGGDGIDQTEITGAIIVLTDTSAPGADGDTLASIEGLQLIASARGSVIDASSYTLGSVTIVGSGGDDMLTGGSGNDVILAGGGSDTVTGGAGNDLIMGGSGGDNLSGGIGSDTIRGGRGRDTIEGGSESDVLVGGGGRDTISGGDGDDRILGGGGRDLLDGDDGADTLLGRGGRDDLAGGLGADNLNGTDVDDNFDQQVGPDKLLGGQRPAARPAPVTKLVAQPSGEIEPPPFDTLIFDGKGAEEIDDAFTDSLLPQLLEL